MRRASRIFYILTLTLATVAMAAAISVGLQFARATGNTVWVPVGAGYEEETIQLFAQQAISHNTDLTVTLRVLPITYATHPFTITAQERAENLELAMSRAGQVDTACETLVISPVTCVATVVDIQVRNDASNPTYLAELGSDVDGIYILGGDQTIAMQVVANTPAEDAMETLFLTGVPISGNSAGAAVQSRYMIAGYIGDNYAWHGLNDGAIDLWYDPITATTRGLKFGLETAVIEQHALERGRIARLLQAAYRKPGQRVGVGVDWGTGVAIINGQTVTQTAGWYAGIILDEETYGSAENAAYTGINQTLSIHDVAFHILPEGAYGYDLSVLRPIVNGVIDSNVPDISTRNLNLFPIPATAGTLMLGGDLSYSPAGAAAQRFATLAKASGGPTVVLAAGYATEAAAEAAAAEWVAYLTNLGVNNLQTATITPATNPVALGVQLSAAGAIFMVGGDQEIIAGQVPLMQSLHLVHLLQSHWYAGKLILFDNAATAVVGDWITAEPTPDDYEVYASDSFLADYVVTATGLGLIPGVMFEPHILYDYLYGRLVNHVYQHPETVAFGIEIGTAIEVSPLGTTVVGDSALFVVDSRYAGILQPGTNGAIAATWLLIDSFAHGDVIAEPVWHIYLPVLTSGE